MYSEKKTMFLFLFLCAFLVLFSLIDCYNKFIFFCILYKLNIINIFKTSIKFFETFCIEFNINSKMLYDKMLYDL